MDMDEMNSPGTYSLGSFSITTAGTTTGDWTTASLEGMLAMLVQLRFVYGSGGTTVRAYLQTTIDGSVPIDIACVLYGTATENAALNFSALTPKTTAVVPADGALTDDTAVDGILGESFRLKVVSTGTYAGSTSLTGTVHVR